VYTEGIGVMLVRGARVLGVVLMSLALLAACGTSTGVAVNCQGLRIGSVYAEPILVEHENGHVDPLILTVQCTSSDEVQIRDPHGKTYHDIDDFRAHNDLLTARDTMDVPRRIPSRGADVGVVTVSGHTSGPPQTVWWLIGGAVLLAVVAGVVIWRRIRRQARPQPDDD